MPSTLRGRSAYVVLLVIVLSVLPAHGAAAHSALIGSNPSSGSTISALPAEIELRFNEKLSNLAPALLLRRDNKTIAKLQPRVDQELLRADRPEKALPDGEYQLVWRVVSEDGHPLSGVVPFGLGGDQAPAAEAPSKATAPDQSPSNNATAVILGIVPVIALAALFLVRLTRSSKKKEQT